MKSENMFLCNTFLLGFMVITVFAVEEKLTNYENLYTLGMEAYKDGKWEKCTTFFSSAMEAYHFYTDVVIDCRIKCKKEVSSDSDKNYDISFDLFFYDIIKKSDCLRRCKKGKFGQQPDLEVSQETNKKFEEKAPYNYLQFCYFKQNKLKEATAAAYTYFITHQGDDSIVGTLQYYRDHEDVKQEDFIDKERKAYQNSYIEALEAYNEGRWKESTASFKLALEQYYVEEERCRASCEKGFTQTGFPDFVNAIADHYITVIVCQQKCLQTLSTFGMKELDNFVADHYNYLQYAYYESGKMTKAFQEIANYLLFRPKDHEMLANKEYYLKTLRRKEEEFVPSQEVVNYVKLWQTIDRTLDFVREHYTLSGIEAAEEPDEETMKRNAERRSRILESFDKLGIRMTEDFVVVEGNYKYAMDGLIREDQCQAIADVARIQKLDANGVRKVSVSQAIDYVKEDEGLEICLRLLLRAGDMMNAFTFAFFNQSKMFIHDTSIVCRAPGQKWGEKLGKDCIPQEDGTCFGKGDNSEFMVVAFLTDVSDGSGQFYFMDESYEPRYRLSPRCGRVIGFAGNNLHGLDLSEKDERCAIIIYLSTEEEKLNPALKEAKDVLSSLEQKHVEDVAKEDREDILDQYFKQGVTIAKTGEDLLGSERFVADGLATEEECSQLIDLAKQAGVSGDGYFDNQSPLSEREIFTGVSISMAEKGMLQGDGYQRDTARFISPYTKTENFEGLNISRTLKLIDSDEVSANTLQLLLDLSDHGRLLVEKYLSLTRPLYFDYTHLVCRTAVEGYEYDPEQLSHPVHSDNCMIQPNGSCLPDRLAYVQRHYSAIMYLNDDFEGGEFFFAHKDKSEQISLAPKCGRIVAFNASDFHGVKGVRQGQRCAIAMWYTHDPNYIEVARTHANRRLDRLFAAEEEGQWEELREEALAMTDPVPPESFEEDIDDHDEL